jgi:hypothetical protein
VLLSAAGSGTCAYDLARNRLFGHVKPCKKRTRFLEFCQYLRTLYPPDVRMTIVGDNYSPHLTTKRLRSFDARQCDVAHSARRQ